MNGTGATPRTHLAWRIASWAMFAFPAAFITAFTARYGYQPVVVPLHMAEVALASLLVAASFRLVARSVRPHARLAVALIGATALSLYLFVIALSSVTNEAWGWSVSIDLGRAYLPLLPGIVANLPVSGSLVIAAVVVFVLLVGGFYWLWWRAAPVVLSWARTRRIRPAWWLAAAATLVAFIVLARRSPSAGAEPFTALLTPPGVAKRDEARSRNVAARRAYDAGPVKDPRNVILIFSDALRADHMGVYGYDRPTTPFLSRLDSAGRLRKAALALATCPFTACGVMSTLASRDSAVLDLGALTIEDVLHDRGYRTNFIGASDHTVWYTLRLHYGDNVDYFFDGWSTKRYTLNDDRLVLEGLEGVPAAAGRPGFFFLFLTSTHTVGTKLPEFRRWTPAEVGFGAGEVTARVNAYDNGILQADSTIASIFSLLDARGYLRHSIVMILGDHGDAFGEHGEFGHTLSLHQETLHIPLLVYDTDSSATYANLDFAAQSDIAPTILARLGLPAPAEWQGRSLLDGAPRTVSTHWTDRARPWHAVVYREGGRTWKYMYQMRWGFRHEELYELASDPGERTDRVRDAGVGGVLEVVRRRAELRWGRS